MAITLDEAVTQALGTAPKPAAPAPSVPDSALSAAVDRMYDPGREAAKTVLADALKALPEQAANDQQMARAFGLPLELVERNRERVQQDFKLRELQQVVNASPILQAQMMNPEFAKLAHDDAPVLGTLAQALQLAGNAGKATLSGIGPKFNEGAWGLVRAAGDVMGVAGRPISESAARLGGVARAQAEALMPKADNVWGAGVYSGFQSLGLNLTQLPLAFLPGGQAALAPRLGPTLASMGLNTGGQAYGQARDQWLGVAPSLIFGGSQGVIEAGTGMIGLPALFKLLKPGQLGTKALSYLLKEQGGEQIATALQDLNEWGVLPEHKNKSIGDYLAERPNAALQTAIATAVGGGAQVALMKGAGMVINHAEYSQFKAQQAEQRAAMLAQLGELARASKVLQRDPESFEQFVAKAAEDGPVDTVYIDGQALMQSGVAAQVAAASPAVAEQLAQAAQTGGTVAIPVSEYAASIAPTEYAQALQEHLRTEPDGYSPAEAKLYMQEQGQQVQEQLERAISQAQQGEEFRASAEAVKGTLLEQLNAAQRFRPEVNEAYAAVVAAYYATRAAQMGATPQELYARRPLLVRAQGLGGAQFDQQGTIDGNPYTPPVVELSDDLKDVILVAYRDAGGDAAHGIGAIEDSANIPAKSAAFQALARQEGYEVSYSDARGKYLRIVKGDVNIPVRISDHSNVNRSAHFKESAINLSPDDGGGFDTFASALWKLRNAKLNEDLDLTFGGEDALYFQFAGQQALTADHYALANAAAMESSMDMEDIRQQTGWHRGVDGKWRFEISDADAKLKVDGRALGAQAKPLGDVLDHPALFAAYPELGQLQVSVDPTIAKGGGEIKGRQIKVGAGSTSKEILSALLHEIQHGIQSVEGFAAGGSTESPALMPHVRRIYSENIGQFQGESHELVNMAKHRAYQNLAGEVEARNTQARQGMTDAERSDTTPSQTADVADANVIVTFNGKDAAHAPMPANAKQAARQVLHQAGLTPTAQALAAWRAALAGLSPRQLERAAKMDVPAVLRALGVKAPKLALPTRYLLAIQQKHPDVPASVFENLPSLLSDPLLAFPHVKGGWRVIVEATTERGEPIAVGVGADGRIQTVTPMHDEEGGRTGVERVREAFERSGGQRGVKRYARNNEAPADAGASVGAPSATIALRRDSSNRRDLILREHLVKRHGEDFYQRDNAPRGMFSPERLTISLLKKADLSTFLHESGHFFFENDIALASEILAAQQQGASITAGEQQLLDDVGQLLTWHGMKGDVRAQLAEWHNLPFEEKRGHHEKTAESFEAYLFSGRAPSAELAPYFQKFRAWLVNVYRGLKEFLAGHPQAGALTPEVRAVFDRMLASNDAILAAEQARSMLALFENAEQGGFSPEAWAAYQGLDAERTQAAVQELQARGLRDLQWLRGARSRELKALQKKASGLRAAIETDVRQQIMAEPVYRAWRFLTSKLTEDDQIGTPPAPPKSGVGLNREVDSLLVAIAKLGGIARESAGQHLGVHKDDFRTPSGVFGRPLFRKEGGLSADAMAELLVSEGYLTGDEDGKHDLRLLEDLVAEELGGRPQYSMFRDPALAFEQRAGEQVRNPEGLGAGRLDLDSLRQMYGTPGEGQMPVWQRLKDLRMTASKDAMHPDIVAQLFGFTSGDELVRTLLATNPLKDEVAARVDQRMLEQHGELATPEALDRAADAAVHNAARARMVATEMGTLAMATGTKRVEIKLLAAAARQFARETVARLKVRALKPSLFSSAQARAASNAQAAMKRGDAQAALAEKRNELLQTQSARAAHEALGEIERGLKYLRRFDGNVKGLDAEYREQIDALLERFDLRKATSLKAVDRRKSLAQWVEAQREQGIEPNVPQELLDATERKSYKDMTVEEFRGLLDTVRQIEHIGRLKDKLLTARDAREVAAAIAQAAAVVREHGGTAREQPLERERGVLPWLRGVLADHRKFASLLRQMDGGADRGVLQELLVRTMNERGHWEAGRNQQATEALGEIFAPVVAQDGGTTGKASAVFIAEIGASLTRQSRLAVLLNWGNETNRQRLMEGFGWNEAQVGAVLRTLSHADVAAANRIWAFIDGFWPEIEAKEKRMTGTAPEKVQALPFVLTLADGTPVEMRGGYYPLKRDDAQGRAQTDAQLADEMKRGAFTKATTRRGHTKARTEGAQYRLLLDLSVITQHVQQVNHDLAWHEWLVDANKLLDPRRALSQAIVDHYGQEVMDTLRKHLEAIATADLQTGDAMQRALLYMRGAVSRMTMGLSLTTALMQPFGLTQSMVRIGPKHVLKGMGRWVGDAAKFESSMSWIGEKSEMMRLRNLTFSRELSEINASVSRGKSTARKVYDASLFYLMQKMQLIADVPTWIGAYEKALSEGVDEPAAIASADQAVLDSQGGGQTKDTARIQREHPFLAMFYSYFSVTYNLMAESTGKTNFRSPASMAGWFTDMALLAVIPALGPSLLIALMRGEGDDKEWDWWAKKLAEWQAGYLLGTMVGLREASGLVGGMDYAGPPVGRLVAEVGKFGKQLAQGEVDDALVRSLANVVGAATGAPTTQALRSWKGWQAWDEGRAPPTAMLMGPPPKH